MNLKIGDTVEYEWQGEVLRGVVSSFAEDTIHIYDYQVVQDMSFTDQTNPSNEQG